MFFMVKCNILFDAYCLRLSEKLIPAEHICIYSHVQTIFFTNKLMFLQQSFKLLLY